MSYFQKPPKPTEAPPKCDLTGKHPSGDPNAQCEPIPGTATQPGVPTVAGKPDPKQDILLTLPGCGHCAAAKATEGIKNGLAEGSLREVSFYSKEGQDLAAKHDIKGAPNIIHAGEVCHVSTEGEALCDKAGTIEYGKGGKKNDV